MNEMKTTADALRWVIGIIEDERVNVSFGVDAKKKFARAKEILALAEFVESDESPDYSKDGGFEALLDTTPAAYEFTVMKEKDCPICRKPYASARPTKFGGLDTVKAND